MQASTVALTGSLVPLLPMLGVAVAGIYLCRSRLRKSHPRACSFATFGWVAVMLRAFLEQGMDLYLVAMRGQTGSFASIGLTYNIFRTANYLVLLAALVFFLLAMLADRGR